MVKKKPTLLGELKGIGLGRFLAFNGVRLDATILVEDIDKQLKAYNRSGDLSKKYSDQMEKSKFGTQMFELTQGKERLRSLLPASIDEEFIEKVRDKINSSNGSADIDWTDIQKSSLFESIKTDHFMKSDHEYKGLHLETVDKSVGPNELSSKKNNIQNKPLVRNSKAKETLSYNEVRQGLNQFIVSDIFHKYAHIINPDGKIEKRGNRITCGSLNMDLGNKLGLWHRFSDGSKGDIFSFVEEATGSSKYDALTIVANHAGVVPTIKENVDKIGLSYENNKNIIQNNKHEDKMLKDEWNVIDTKTSDAPALNIEKDLRFINRNGGNTTEVYEYKNKDDILIGYAVRIEEIESRKKQVLPVAYCHNEAKAKSRWMLKGFTDGNYKPIYGIEKVQKYPSYPLLIVEGEKTANAAQELFKDHVVLTWMGGANGVGRVNWSELANKPITIWPDNDKPGIEAAHGIKEAINNHNGFSGLVSVVDTKALELQEKWDLADELPSHIEKDQLQNIIKSSHLDIGLNNKVNYVKDDRIINSLEMLVARGKTDKDEYVSKEMYHESLHIISGNKRFKLDDLTPETFADGIRSLQDEYRQMQNSYGTIKGTDKESRLVSELVRDASILHQLQLGITKLPENHTKQLQGTALEKVLETKYLSNDSDKELLGSKVHKAITDKSFSEKLEYDNQKKISE